MCPGASSLRKSWFHGRWPILGGRPTMTPEEHGITHKRTIGKVCSDFSNQCTALLYHVQLKTIMTRGPKRTPVLQIRRKMNYSF